MSKRGASTKEIEDALAKLPGPGIPVKTGSPAGIGQDIIDIFEGLRTGIYKHGQQQREDIKDIGRLKRADIEKGIEGESAITEAGATGKKDIVDRSIQDKKVISEREAANIMKGLKEDEAAALKLFAAENSATKELAGMGKELIDQFLEQYKAKTARITAEAAKRTSESRTTPTIKPAVYAEVRKVFESMQNAKFQVSVDDTGNRQIRFINGKPLDTDTRNKVNSILAEANQKVEAGQAIGTVSAFMKDKFKKLSETVSPNNQVTRPRGVPNNFRKGTLNGQTIWISPTNPSIAYDSNGDRLP